MNKHSYTNLHSIPELQLIDIIDEIVIRPLAYADSKRIIEIINSDKNIRKRVSFASSVYTNADFMKQVEAYTNDSHLIRYAILELDNPIGLISFWRDIDSPFEAPDNPDDYGFGYFLDPAKRGGGIVTASIRAIMDVAVRNLQINQFIAYCEDSNLESITVLTKLGFRPTDTILTENDNGWVERKYVLKNTNP